MQIYERKRELEPVTIFFYEKMLHSLSGLADAAENTGEVLLQIIIKR